jgi:hypothetical protein
MGDLLQMSKPNFTRSVTKTGSRTLILSTCTLCGQKRLASLDDGSLARWEQGHACKDAAGNGVAIVSGSARSIL